MPGIGNEVFRFVLLRNPGEGLGEAENQPDAIIASAANPGDSLHQELIRVQDADDLSETRRILTEN